MFDIQAELKKLPDSSGVYIMRDESDAIIYVGKAKVLKNRVRQYFQSSKNHSVKVRRMVSHIDHFEYIVTNSEVEALILENNLIKQNQPKYNILLKDDKTYPYIKVTVNEEFPRIFMTREHLKDKAKYFGPFTSGLSVKENLELINKIWHIRKCARVLPRDIGKYRPCLNYHLKRCKAPCNGFISKEEYGEMVKEVLDFLSGKTEAIEQRLSSQMLEASDKMEFERAAELRDTLRSIRALKEKQVIENQYGDDRDVIGYAKAGSECVMQIFFIRGGNITGREHFMFEDCAESSESEIMTEFVEQFYSGTPFIPKEVILQCDIGDFDLVSEWLSSQKGQRVNVLIPQKGERKRLVDLARNNAQITLDKFGMQIRREHNRTKGALKEIQEALGVDFELNRLESYDISNTQGYESVASMVVFENGMPKRSDYRKFKLKSIVGPDDYGSMREVITRRFTRYINETSGEDGVKKAGFDKLPDMIFADGGKGQISAIIGAIESLGLKVEVCGMVKDDRHRTRALLYNGRECPLDTHSEGFKLLTRLQDEVHRFAIEYHRQLRGKQQVKSILDDIKGIGAVRRKALIRHFGSIDLIMTAELEELKKVEGMDSRSAEAVYSFFRDTNK